MWTVLEDERLSALVCVNGPKAWRSIAADIPNRSAKQCLNRWRRLNSRRHDENVLDYGLELGLDGKSPANEHIVGRGAKCPEASTCEEVESRDSTDIARPTEGSHQTAVMYYVSPDYRSFEWSESITASGLIWSIVSKAYSM